MNALHVVQQIRRGFHPLLLNSPVNVFGAFQHDGILWKVFENRGNSSVVFSLVAPLPARAPNPEPLVFQLNANTPPLTVNMIGCEIAISTDDGMTVMTFERSDFILLVRSIRGHEDIGFISPMVRRSLARGL